MDSPPSVNYGWSYFHMDSPTDKNPADSGLRIRILRTPDPGPFFDGQVTGDLMSASEN